MENRSIRRTLYKVLRKTGVPRKEIELEASFKEDLRFDHVDWALFLFYLEKSFNISINDDAVLRLKRVKDSLELVKSIA